MSLCINPRCANPHNPNSNRFCQSCGSELLLCGRYQVIRLLSDKGGFAKTYEVLDRSTPKVLKVLTNPHPHGIKLFQQEARLLQQLQHPGIPRGDGSFIYYPRDSQTPVYCLVMEKIEGQDLEEYLQSRKLQPISQELALDWLLQLATILHEVHRQNFFHRDIKPSNIILKPDGHLTLIDFGAARQVTTNILRGGKNTEIYTVGYAPPEQSRGYAVLQSDFYALGRTFVFLLTGKEPNDPQIYEYQNNQLKWQKLAPHISDELADFIDELMAESVKDRMANTAVILKRIKLLQQYLYPSKTVVISPHQSQPVSLDYESNTALNELRYAGLWLRCKAALIDGLILLVFGGVIGGYMGANFDRVEILKNLTLDFGISPLYLHYWLASWTALGTTFLGLLTLIALGYLHYINPLSYPFDQPAIGVMAAVVLGMLLKWLYFILGEWAFKGSFGKLLCGLRITNAEGNRISLGQANKRYWAKIIFNLPIYIGFIVAGWTERKRAVYDIIARTFILRKK